MKSNQEFNRGSAILLLTLLSTAILWSFGCNRTKIGGAGKRHKLAFVTNNASDYWTIARKGTEKAHAELPNVDVDFRIDSDGTAAEQQRVVDDLLAKGIEGIAISPVDPANQTPMLNKAAAQSLVITQDSDAPNSNRTCYIGTDNVAAGRQAGQLVKEALQGSNVQIVDVRTDNTDRVRAKSNAADTLVNNPDIAGLVGLWSYNGPAIVSAVRDAGKFGKVKIVAFDEEDETLSAIKDGAIYATVVQQPFEFGRQSIEMMTKILDGDRSMIPASKQIFVPTIAVKKDGIDAFITKINQLRGR